MSRGRSSRRSRRAGSDTSTRAKAVEVLPKFLFRDHARKVLMRGGKDSNVERDALASADSLAFLLLQDAQDLRLERHGHVADFVEQNRSALRGLEFSRPRLDSRRHTALDAEKLRLEERFGEGGAVDRDERTLASRALLVDQTGDQLLARAAFPRDENRNGRDRHPGHDVQDASHRNRLADEERIGGRPPRFVPESPVLLFEPVSLLLEPGEAPAAFESDAGKRGERGERKRSSSTPKGSAPFLDSLSARTSQPRLRSSEPTATPSGLPRPASGGEPSCRATAAGAPARARPGRVPRARRVGRFFGKPRRTATTPARPPRARGKTRAPRREPRRPATSTSSASS